MRRLLAEALRRSARYLEDARSRRVGPAPADVARLSALDGPLPEGPTDPEAVLARLDELGSPATVINAGGRFFGFVNGAALPAALAADWLASAWDQNAGLVASSPTAAALEEISVRWVCELLRLPAGTGGALVTGASTSGSTFRMTAASSWSANPTSSRPPWPRAQATWHRACSAIPSASRRRCRAAPAACRPQTTRAVIAAIQDEGTCWCGGTVWQGQTPMRIASRAAR